MITLPSAVQKSDTFAIWRQKTNEAIQALSDIEVIISGADSLTSQFEFVPNPLATNQITTKAGKLRNRNIVFDIPQTDTPIGVGQAEVLFADGATQNFSLGYTVVDNDPDVAVFINGVLTTSGYAIVAPDQIQFSGFPANGTVISVLKKSDQKLAIDGTSAIPNVALYNDNIIPVNNTIPIYKVLGLKFQGFTGNTIRIWTSSFSVSSIVDFDGISETTIPDSLYDIAEDGTVTFSAPYDNLSGKIIHVYGVENDIRTWAVAAVDIVSENVPAKIEWAQTMVAPTTVVLTAISDDYIGHISVYLDGIRKTSALGSNDYTVGASGGFVQLTFTTPIPAGVKLLVVANQDDHPVVVEPILVEFVANPVPQTVYDLTGTDLEGIVFPNGEKYIAVYVSGVRQTFGTYTITDFDEITFDNPITNMPVFFVVNEPNGLDGAAALELNGGNTGDILYRDTGLPNGAKWAPPTFDASSVTSGTFDISLLPIATTKEVIEGVVEDKAVLPKDAAIPRLKSEFGKWRQFSVGSKSDFFLTNCTKNRVRAVPSVDLKQYVATRCGRIFENINTPEDFTQNYFGNAPFAPVNWIACTDGKDGSFAFAKQGIFVAGNKGKLAKYYFSYGWSDISYSTFSGIDDTWDCIQVESFSCITSFSSTLIGGWDAVVSLQGNIGAFVFQNSTATAWRIYLAHFSTSTGNIDAVRFLEQVTTKPVINSHIIYNYSGRGTHVRFEWFVGNVYKYILNDSDLNNAPLSQTLAAIAGENVIDFVTWNTRNANTVNSEATNSGLGFTFGSLLTDKGKILISCQPNAANQPFSGAYSINGPVFSDAAIDDTGTCKGGKFMFVSNDAFDDTQLGRRIVALSDTLFPVTTTSNSTSAFNPKMVGISSAFTQKIVASICPTYSQFFGDTSIFSAAIVQNELGDIASVIADSGLSKTTNHSIAFSGAIKAFTSDSSPAPAIGLKKVVGNGVTKIAVAASPINMVWVLEESLQGGHAIPIQENIIDVFCEGKDGNRFFLITDDNILYSVDGITWLSEPHGVTIGSGNGVYEMSAMQENIPGPTVRTHYAAIIDGTLVISKNNAAGWTGAIQPFVAQAGTWQETTAQDFFPIFLALDDVGVLHGASYSDISAGNPLTVSYNTTVITAVQKLGNFVYAVDTTGLVYKYDAGWVQVTGMTLNGDAFASLGTVSKLAASTVMIATASTKYYVTANGKDWIDFILPTDGSNPVGNISHSGLEHFLCEMAINNPTGRLPTYYLAYS